MIARSNAIIPVTPAEDHTGKEGYFVNAVAGEAALVTTKTDGPIGVILDGKTTAGQSSIALRGAGLSGTVKVKLNAAPGTVIFGTLLEIAADGTVKADGEDTGTVVAIALESGSGGELIEAMLLTANQTITVQQGYRTSVTPTADGAELTVAGQVTDAAGNALAGRFLVGVFFGEAANDGTPFDFGDLAAGAGSVLVSEQVADALATVLTAADGSWSVVLTLGADDTVHPNAWVQGAVTAGAGTAVDVP